MAEGISKTDEVLILLNRLEAHPNADAEEESDLLLARQPKRRLDREPDASRSPPAGRGVLQGLQSTFQSKLASAVELGAACLKPADALRPPVSPLEVVLGEQPRRDPAALRKTESFRRKLFGQEGGREEEGLAAAPAGRAVRVHPHSAFHRYWESAVLALTAYTIVVLPYRAAFHNDYYGSLDHGHHLLQQLQVDWMLATDVLVDAFFLADIALNFNTGYVSDQAAVMDRRLVAAHYCRTWLGLDAAASLPLDLLFLGKRLDIWRLPRLLKLVRVLHYKALAQAVRAAVRIAAFTRLSRFHLKILRLLLILLVWVHWAACLNYGVNCWVEAAGLAHAPPRAKFAWAFLKALSETITAGYGVQEPASLADCCCTIACLFVGVCLWSYLSALVTSLLISAGSAGNEYMLQAQQIDAYMEHRRLPRELRQRIRDSYEARWKAEKHFNEEAILAELPTSLRTEVCMHQCAALVASVPFFADAEPGFTTSLVTRLRPQVFLRGDQVVREGEVADEMFFIASGAAQVELDGWPVTVLKAGSYFGECGLLRQCRRNATVTALSPTLELFVLSKEDFDGVFSEYQDSWKAMDLVAEHRVRALHRSHAWQRRQQQQPDAAPHLGDMIQHILEVCLLPPSRPFMDSSWKLIRSGKLGSAEAA